MAFPRAGKPFPTLAQSLLQANRFPLQLFLGTCPLCPQPITTNTSPGFVWCESWAEVQPKGNVSNSSFAERERSRDWAGPGRSREHLSPLLCYHHIISAKLSLSPHALWCETPKKQHKNNPTRVNSPEILLKAFQLLETFMATSRCVCFEGLFFPWTHSHLWRA